MAVSRCPHCQQLLLPDEALAPSCMNCGEALPGAAATSEAAAPVPAAAAIPPPAPRTPWFLWAAVALLALSNGATLAWMFWPRATDRPSDAPHQDAIADASPPETTAPPSPIKPLNNSPKVEGPKPADQPAAPAADAPKPPAPAPPPAPMPPAPAVNPPAPPPVAVAPFPPAPLPPPDPPGRIEIEGMQGRIDWNAAGEVVGLRLGNSGLSDNELCLLQPFDNLRELDLGHTPVTDKGLLYLQRLKGLRKLSVRGAAVSDAGVAALQKALPDLKIAH